MDLMEQLRRAWGIASPPFPCLDCKCPVEQNPDTSWPEYCRVCWDERKHHYSRERAIALKQVVPRRGARPRTAARAIEVHPPGGDPDRKPLPPMPECLEDQ